MLKKIVLGLVLAASVINGSSLPCNSQKTLTKRYGDTVVNQVGCSGTVTSHKKKYTYDLTPLKEYGELNYYSRVYNNIYMLFCDYAPSCSGMSVCSRSALGQNFGFGDPETLEIHPINDSVTSADKGITVTFTNGHMCQDNRKASAVIYILCDTVEGVIEDAQIDENYCTLKATVKSIAGCPVSKAGGGLSAGSIILIILVVLVVLYFGLGAAYQWKFKEPQSIPEYIIHNEFWFALPGLVKDGVIFIAHGFKKGDYTTV